VKTYLDESGAYQRRLQQRQAVAPGGEAWPEALPHGEAPVMPEALDLYLQCERHGVLLVAGGILDQPTLMWQEVDIAGRAYRDWQNEHVQEPPRESDHGLPGETG
jgi:hypothetical protein